MRMVQMYMGFLSWMLLCKGQNRHDQQGMEIGVLVLDELSDWK